MEKISIIGFPMDLGADTRGVDMGPSALRIAGLKQHIKALGYKVIDKGNIKIKISSQLKVFNKQMKYVDEIVKASEIFALQTEKALDRGHFPLLIGGDHSMAMGSLAGIAAHCRKTNKTLGLIWVDAHTDMNTAASSPSGNVHGMPLAASLGIGDEKLTNIYGFAPKIKVENVVLVGIRSVDQIERKTTQAADIRVYTMAAIDRRGIYAVISEIIDNFKDKVDHLHISFDMDSIDPDIAPGVGTPIPGGLNFREAHVLMETIAASGMLASLEITEVNPILDIRNKTAELAVNLVESALGKRIL